MASDDPSSISPPPKCLHVQPSQPAGHVYCYVTFALISTSPIAFGLISSSFLLRVESLQIPASSVSVPLYISTPQHRMPRMRWHIVGKR
ncbi:hypothetical protein H4I96_06093 [Botrytis cinerea]